MNHSHITINGIEPAYLSLRHPMGINLEWMLHLHRQNGEPVDPSLSQFVLLPRSLGGIAPYDVEAADPVNGIGVVRVPGTALTDTLGYSIELYSRAPSTVPGDPPLPTGLLAKGTLVTEGSAYTSSGPLNMINIPVVVGPAGPQGETGTRGSIWTTGNGAPSPFPDVLPGDMYLDEDNGDVWRFTPVGWVKGTF